MALCPYCNTAYAEYTIVGIHPANRGLTAWLDPIPLALLACGSCGRFTIMHPDHPDVQRLQRGPAYEDIGTNTRTLNVPTGELGDETLRHDFESGQESPSTR